MVEKRIREEPREDKLIYFMYIVYTFNLIMHAFYFWVSYAQLTPEKSTTHALRSDGDRNDYCYYRYDAMT